MTQDEAKFLTMVEGLVETLIEADSSIADDLFEWMKAVGNELVRGALDRELLRRKIEELKSEIPRQSQEE